jgi:hypothetical protein
MSSFFLRGWIYLDLLLIIFFRLIHDFISSITKKYFASIRINDGRWMDS